MISELKNSLASSDAKLRKHWAQRIADEHVPLQSLMSLLHAENKTAQRFTWLIGDLLDQDPSNVIACLPVLFSLRDQMPFPGMRRTVAKILWFTNVPAEIEEEAIPELFRWLENDQFEVSVKHYASKTLFELVKTDRIKVDRLRSVLRKQSKHPNAAHARRMIKMLGKVN